MRRLDRIKRALLKEIQHQDTSGRSTLPVKTVQVMEVDDVVTRLARAAEAAYK